MIVNLIMLKYSINLDTGFLRNVENENETYVNNIRLTQAINLSKYDKIKIANKIIHWSNYFIEEINQELTIKDFTTFHGRINKKNFRALMVLILGLIPVIYFLPALLFLKKSFIRLPNEQQVEILLYIKPYVHGVGYITLGIFSLLVSVKRMRDTGQGLWKLIVPFENLRKLFFANSNH